MLRALGVIPARFASTRFRGKPLAPLGEETLLAVVWRRARTARRLDVLVVATDDERIADHAASLGAEVCMTSSEHPSGTDRVAQVVRDRDDAFDVVVNIQGDEPFVTGSALDALVGSLEARPAAAVATLWEPATDARAILDPNVVKLVADERGRALYFSRAPIPFPRDEARSAGGLEAALASDPALVGRFRQHQGIYAYRRDALEAWTALSPSALEVREGLEQLRALEAGLEILAIRSDFRSIGVDTPADLKRAAARLAASTGRRTTHTTEESEP